MFIAYDRMDLTFRVVLPVMLWTSWSGLKAESTHPHTLDYTQEESMKHQTAYTAYFCIVGKNWSTWGNPPSTEEQENSTQMAQQTRFEPPPLEVRDDSSKH